MKRNTKRFIIAMVLALAFLITGIPFTEAQAATKPVIRINGTAASGNSVTMKKGEKINLTAKSGKKNITKECTWKSSRKNVATVSKKGVLSAKKAGTTYITVKYKGKTSKKLKVVVLKSKKGPGDTSESGTDTDSPSVSGSHKITYNVNSKNKSDKLNGSSTQYVSGEILRFVATVEPASGHKFVGWFDAPTGGKRIYETYKPTKNMTLYAHYTNKNVQTVKFSLGCNYGYDDTVSFMGIGGGTYDWGNKVPDREPMSPFSLQLLSDDAAIAQGYAKDKDRMWTHTYEVDGKKTFTVDDLPVPSMPGYTFMGWYTVRQDRDSYDSGADFNSGVRVESGQKLSTDITALYARFSKKLTISFDDLHGGTYNDIVVDTYTSIKDCGYHLPVIDIPGATFLGWALTTDVKRSTHTMIITDDKAFTNVMYVHGFTCTADHRNENVGERYFLNNRDYRWHSFYDDNCTGNGGYTDMPMYNETDHITLYPVYNSHEIRLPFDPKGGTFSSSQSVNVTVYKEDSGEFKKGIGYVLTYGDRPYGSGYHVGHEGEVFMQWGNGHTAMPKVLRSNYTFDKWVYLDSNGTERDFDYDTVIVDDMYVYAKWIPGKCRVTFDPTDGTLTQQEISDSGLDGTWSHRIATGSTIAKDGKRLPVPVSKDGRKFEGWFTKDGEQVTADTQILSDMTLYARWGAKTNSKNETQKPSKDKDTDSNNQNEVVQHVTDITVTDMDFQPVDKNNNKFTIEYGGKGKPAGLGFTATVLPKTLKGTAQNVIWTSSNPNIIAVTAGKEVIYSSNWFDYFEFGEETGEVVLTATSEANPNISFHINVVVIKSEA